MDEMEPNDISQETPLPPTDEVKHGYIRGTYWKSVFYVLRRCGRLGPELAEPVDFRHSQKFRWATIGMVMLGSIVTAFVQILDAGNLSEMGFPILLVSVPIYFIVGFISLALTTGTVSWFFSPKKFTTEQQNRAVALSYYTVAPLALLPLAMLPMATIGPIVYSESIEPYVWITGIVALALWLWWYVLIIFASRSVGQRGAVGVTLTALGVLAAGTLISVIAFHLPASVVMWVLMYFSLT